MKDNKTNLIDHNLLGKEKKELYICLQICKKNINFLLNLNLVISLFKQIESRYESRYQSKCILTVVSLKLQSPNIKTYKFYFLVSMFSGLYIYNSKCIFAYFYNRLECFTVYQFKSYSILFCCNQNVFKE